MTSRRSPVVSSDRRTHPMKRACLRRSVEAMGKFVWKEVRRARTRGGDLGIGMPSSSAGRRGCTTELWVREGAAPSALEPKARRSLPLPGVQSFCRVPGGGGSSWCKRVRIGARFRGHQWGGFGSSGWVLRMRAGGEPYLGSFWCRSWPAWEGRFLHKNPLPGKPTVGPIPFVDRRSVCWAVRLRFGKGLGAWSGG